MKAYLELREALGVHVQQFKSRLESFVQYLEQHADGTQIRARFAVDWACNTSPGCGIPGRSARLSIARGFLIHLKATYPQVEVPDNKLIATKRRPTPYLFSDKEIKNLMAAAGQLSPRDSLRPHTHQTLLGLLACTGLRSGEAVNLLVSDIHLDGSPACLFIRNAKFHKSRWVPLHPTAADQLSHYAKLRSDLNYASLPDVFFISEQGRQLDGRILRRTFRRLLNLARIYPRPDQRYPSLHSFRHTFAVERLRRWYQAGADTRTLLPHLSVYLGHVDPAESYWYLTATPELMGASAELFQNYAQKRGGI